jgi:hypothetical protein
LNRVRKPGGGRGWCCAGAAVLALFLGGCGLAEYEALMQEAQVRVQRYYEEDKYLDEPLDMPTRTEDRPPLPGQPQVPGKQQVPLAIAFYRPPKGIQKTCDNTPRQGGLYVYPPKKDGAGPFAQLGLAFDLDPAKLTAEVKGALPTTGPWDYKRIEFRRQGGETLYFDTFESDGDQYSYSVNVYRNAPPKPPAGWTQIAFVFWFAKGQRESARKALNLSLETLVTGPQVGSARLAFKRGGPWGLQPAGTR